MGNNCAKTIDCDSGENKDLEANFSSPTLVRKSTRVLESFSSLQKNKEKKSPTRINDKSQYEGEWTGDVREGYGVQIWDDGSRFEEIGLWIDDKVNGRGRFKFGSGEQYEGQFLDNIAVGQGRYSKPDGSSYEGEWKGNRPNGYGVEKYIDSSKYEGYYKQGMKEGNGTYLWPDKSSYIGRWSQNKMKGQGVFVKADGNKYQGEFINNIPHGSGTFYFADGSSYQGSVVLGERHGNGVYSFANGSSIEGNWIHDNPNGKIKMTTQDGRISSLEYNHGNLIKESSFPGNIQSLSKKIIPQFANSLLNLTLPESSVIDLNQIGDYIKRDIINYS